MRSASFFYVFDKWKSAPAHAFGSKKQVSVVPDEDKSAYASIINELQEAASQAIADVRGEEELVLKQMNYSARFGSRGHRPVDLWVAVSGADSEIFSQMPQIYAIASDRGVEIGFAVSIDEKDYHNPDVKARNRLVVPLLNSKLPQPDAQIAGVLDNTLKDQGRWHFNTKTRLTNGADGYDHYPSLPDMLRELKRTAQVTGGGAISRFYSIDQLDQLDLRSEFANAIQLFLPLMRLCSPTAIDTEIVSAQELVQVFSEDVPAFDPKGQRDAREKVLAEVARRQGQATFRNDLLVAYDGRCAITGTAVPSVLQAAHITPYLGPETNHVTNGLLLRADLHNLFDMGLIKIEPQTLKVEVSKSLDGSEYAALHGRVIASTKRKSDGPSLAALEQQFHAVPKKRVKT